MSESTKTEWIIAIGGSDEDGCKLFSFIGTKDQAKQELLRMIKANKKANFSDCWDYGTDNINNIDDYGNAIYGFNCFANYHVDFEAYQVACIPKSEMFK